MKIRYVIAIHLTRWLTNFNDFRFKWTATAAIGIHPTKAWLSQQVNFKNAIWTFEEPYAIKFCFKLGKNATRWKLDLPLWPWDQETEFPVEACWLSQTQEGQTEQIHTQTFDDPSFWQHWHDLHALGSHWTDSHKEYYVEVLRAFRKRFLGKMPALFKSGQWHFQQDNTPVHNSILITDFLTKMGIKTVLQPPYSPDLAPCDFSYSLSSRKTLEAVVMRQLRRWKRLWRSSLIRWHQWTSRSCWNGTTSALPPEEITSKGTRVSCVYYQ